MLEIVPGLSYVNIMKIRRLESIFCIKLMRHTQVASVVKELQLTLTSVSMGGQASPFSKHKAADTVAAAMKTMPQARCNNFQTITTELKRHTESSSVEAFRSVVTDKFKLK